MKPVRVVDTGLRQARANIALDQAMIEAHKRGEIPDTVRFLRFPPSALIGRHQALSQELKLDWCRANGVEIARRLTGGGAIVMGPGLLGWELIVKRSTLGLATLDAVARKICEAVAAGLSSLGVEARFRPRNDIEVGGRKLSGSGGFFDGDTLLYQGTVILDFDAQQMLSALNVPAEKLIRHAVDSAAQRVVSLRELLGPAMPPESVVADALLRGLAEGLGLAPHWARLSNAEEDAARIFHDREIGTDAFVAQIDPPRTAPDLVTAQRDGAGGSVRANIRLEAGGTRVREVLLTGDFFVTPPRVIYDLEAKLRGLAVGEVAAAVDAFFAAAEIGLLTIAPSDFKAAIQEALLKARR